MRLFFGVMLPADLRKRLAQAADGLFEVVRPLRLVPPPNYHVTLRFLGAVDETRLGELTPLANEVAQTATPFVLSLKGIESFTTAKGRVLCAAVDHGREDMIRLMQAVDQRFSELVGGESRPARPHVTLARLRERHMPESLERHLATMRNVHFGTMEVRAFALLCSESGRRSARYRALESFAFGAAQDKGQA